MRVLALLLLTLTPGPGQAFEVEEIPLRQLLTGREYRRYQSKRRYKDRMDLYRKVFERQGDNLTRQLRRSASAAEEVLRRLRALSHHAGGEEAQPDREKDLRSKQVKKLEITLRKLLDELDNLKTSAPLELFEDFEKTAFQLEELRTRLLRQIFGKTIGGLQSAMERTLPAPAVHSFLPSAQRRRRIRPTGDRFTDEEFTRIQVAQKLEKRVKVFLEIAEARLDEIDRRREGREWTEDEENPLEFFTYRDMVHAYGRALDSLMINIDEKATHRTASEKEIRKSLELLNEKIQVFIPRLEPLQKLAVELNDRDLHEMVLKAEEISIVAQKGSQYGLGAPRKK